MKTYALILTGILCAFPLAGCAQSQPTSTEQMTSTARPTVTPTPRPTVRPQPSPGAQPSPSPTGQLISECFWGATVEVWEDTNSDGVRAPGEKPLTSVRVITDYGKDHQIYREDRTGPGGVVEIGGISNICDWENYTVMVVAPAGYTHTTPQSMAFSEAGNGATMLFGLKPE